MTPLKTLSYASGRPEIVEGNEMKNVADCLESIQNGEHDKYPYTYALTELMDANVAENMLRTLCESCAEGSDFAVAIRINGRSLGIEINNHMYRLAKKMSQASVTPLDNDTNIADVRKEM